MRSSPAHMFMLEYRSVPLGGKKKLQLGHFHHIVWTQPFEMSSKGGYSHNTGLFVNQKVSVKSPPSSSVPTQIQFYTEIKHLIMRKTVIGHCIMERPSINIASFINQSYVWSWFDSWVAQGVNYIFWCLALNYNNSWQQHFRKLITNCISSDNDISKSFGQHN